jgi:hypothetical protein
MKVLSANIKNFATTIVTSVAFDALDPVSQLDILKCVIDDLRVIYSDKLKEQRALKPSKQKEISAKAKERALQALKLRKKGWTFKAVGVAMHVSASRAAQLVSKAERIIKHEERWAKNETT